MDCIDVPDNRVVSFIVGMITMFIIIMVGWISIHFAGNE